MSYLPRIKLNISTLPEKLKADGMVKAAVLSVEVDKTNNTLVTVKMGNSHLNLTFPQLWLPVRT